MKPSLKARALAELELQRRYAAQAARRASMVPVDEWIERYCVQWQSVDFVNWNFKNALPIRLTDVQRRILQHTLTLDTNGNFPYDTIIYSTIKKSGKTQLAGCVGAWYADNIEPPNVVLCIANAQTQSTERIFQSLLPTMKLLGAKVPNPTTMSRSQPHIYHSKNGTVIQAITNNAEIQAGGNYGLTLWSEIWGFTSENDKRFYDELMPVPTRQNSLRWIETYMGFEDESVVLMEQYNHFFMDTKEIKLHPKARYVPKLTDIVTTNGEGEARPACIERPDLGMFMFLDHERRMPWQNEEYYQRQKGKMRMSSYVRLCENRWQQSEGNFMQNGWIERATKPTLALNGRMVLAIDASQRNDTTSIVGVNQLNGRYRVLYCIVWNPQGKDLDLEATVMAEILRLWRTGLIFRRHDVDAAEKDDVKKGYIPIEVYCDPFQMHQVRMNLKTKHRLLIKEFNQGTERSLADSFLYDQFKNNNIDLIDYLPLQEHFANAKAKEQEGEKLRIIKGTMSTSGKVDAAVAASMAIYKMSLRRSSRLTASAKTAAHITTLAQGKAQGW
jgi:phage terminase large subunit-like protein